MSGRLTFCLVCALLSLPALAQAQEVVHDRGQAVALLQEMVGTWRIQRPDATSTLGVRTVRSGVDEITLEWEETLQAGDLQSRGYVGYDPIAARYYMIGVHSNPQAKVSFLEGTPEGDGRTIRWLPVAVETDRQMANRELITSVMRLEEGAPIVWRAHDNGWVFNLVPQ